MLIRLWKHLCLAGALQDLDKAIELSEGRGKAACQAYTQRAMLHKLDGTS